MNFRDRLQRLRRSFAGQHAGALLLTQGPDLRYLCGFTGSNGLLLLFRRSATLFTDGRYTTQAAEESAGSGVRIVIAKQLLPAAIGLLVRAGAESVAYDSNHTAVAVLERMQRSLPESYNKAARRRFFVPLAASPVAAMRETKDEDELAILSEAAQLGCRIFQSTLPHLATGVSEREIAAELEYSARKLGAEGMSFETIVASGERSALPHGHASDRKLPRRGFVTMDFGVILRGYRSDMTRTVYLGRPTREERLTYEAVLAAEEAGVAAVRAGVSGHAVDQAARDVLKDRGLAKFFTHSTGHGVGLEIHEEPRLGRKVEAELLEGMVVTVEPGVYLPGRFGIRIEDMVVVEKEGGRVLTPAPKELLTL